MEGLYAIPLLGPVLEFLGYLVNLLATTSTPAITLSLATPIALGALCGVMNERSGVVNIGIEGMMLTSAFVGFIAALAAQHVLGPSEPSPVFGGTPALIFGVVAAVVAGMLVSALHAW